MLTFPLAQLLAGYSFLQLFLLVVLIAAAVAIVAVALRGMGIAVPAWAVQIGWILVIAFVAIVAIYVLFSMVGRV